MTAHSTNSSGFVHAGAWRAQAPLLASWARRCLVNRDDAYGAYLPKNQREDGRSAVTAKREPTDSLLERHFCGGEVGHLMGLHSTSIHNMSRWIAIDLDNHDEDDSIAAANLSAALCWYERLAELGYRPLLMDSDGQGGLHLWVIFDQPVATSAVFHFGRQLTSDWESLGLATEPETFPKQERIQANGFGNWLRLPGRHHTRQFFSQVWQDGEWKAGEPAIEVLLEAEGQPFTECPDSKRIIGGEGTPKRNLSTATIGRLSMSTRRFVEGGAPIGSRNNELYKAAVDMRGNGFAQSQIEESAGASAIESGLCADEVKRTIRSAAAEPRTPTVSVMASESNSRPFPVRALPVVLRQLVEETTDVFGCDSSMVALPAIVAVAGAIGNSCRIQLRPEWTEPCVFWGAIVADSGSLKSPVLELLVTPLNGLQTAELLKSTQDCQVPVGHEDGGHTQSIARTVVADTTLEALAVRLSENPRGLLICRDELYSWLTSFDAYRSGRGGDESQFLVMHGARALIVDRKTGNKRTLYIPRAAVSILGCIPPGSLRRALGRPRFESGLVARFLFVAPRSRRPEWKDHAIGRNTYQQYCEVIRKARNIPVDLATGNELVPNIVHLGDGAKKRWQSFYNHYAKLMNGTVDEDLLAAYGKLEGYAARITLVLHVVTCVHDGVEPSSLQVAPETLQAAVTVTEWFRAEAERVYDLLAESPEDATRRGAVRYIQRQGGSITVRDLQRAGIRGLKSAPVVRGILDSLADAGFGIWNKPRGKGPNAGDVFTLAVVNPTPDR